LQSKNRFSAAVDKRVDFNKRLAIITLNPQEEAPLKVSSFGGAFSFIFKLLKKPRTQVVRGAVEFAGTE